MVNRVQTLRSSVKGQRPVEGTYEVGTLYVNFAELQLGVVNTTKAAQDLLAITWFSLASDYQTGDVVVQNGVLYVANGNIPAGAFIPSQWTRVVTTIDLATKENVILPGDVSQYWRGDKTWQVLDKVAVGLPLVDNTSDLNKPISNSTQNALNLKVNRAGDTMGGHLGLPTGPSSSQAVRKDYVDGANALLQGNIDLKANIASPTFTGDPKAPTPPLGDNDTSLATTAFVTRAVTQGTLGFVTEAPIDGIQYVRSDAHWEPVIVPEENFIGDVPPPAPQVGQLWYESDTGDTFLWYDDGTSQQWVQINSGIATGGGAGEPGQVSWFAMNAPPYGWLKCNGAAVSRNAYARLFNTIGTTWGAGNTVTTFNVPDLRGEFVRGWDDERGVDIARLFASAQAANMASHTHTASGGNHAHTASSGNVSADHAHYTTTGTDSANHYHSGTTRGPTSIQSGNWGSQGAVGDTTGNVSAWHTHAGWSGGINTNHTHAIYVAAADVTPTIAAYGTGTDTRPRNVALLACIRY